MPACICPGVVQGCLIPACAYLAIPTYTLTLCTCFPFIHVPIPAPYLLPFLSAQYTPASFGTPACACPILFYACSPSPVSHSASLYIFLPGLTSLHTPTYPHLAPPGHSQGPTHMMQPSAQMSDWQLCPFLETTSGARKFGVPQSTLGGIIGGSGRPGAPCQTGFTCAHPERLLRASTLTCGSGPLAPPWQPAPGPRSSAPCSYSGRSYLPSGGPGMGMRMEPHLSCHSPHSSLPHTH